MRRFYKDVETVLAGDGFGLALDGRPVRTPLKAALRVPGRALADAIAEEWHAQGETIDHYSMLLTQIANTGIDRVPAHRTAIVEELARYAETDLVCYRADAPADLVARQSTAWQPLLDWLAEVHGARLVVTTEILHQAQPAEAIAKLRQIVDAHDDFTLAALHLATGLAGSLVIALALAGREIDAEAAFVAATVDELYQAELWGEDGDAAERRARVKIDIDAAARFIELCGTTE